MPERQPGSADKVVDPIGEPQVVTAPVAARPAGVARSLRQRWPTLLGLGFTVVIALRLGDGVDLAPVVAVSALIYLGASALRNRSSVWALFAVGILVVVATEALLGDGVGVWVLIGLAVPVFAYGLVNGATQEHDGFTHQTIAMVGFGAVSALALAVGPTAGAYLVAAGLLGHAAWDVYHYRVNRVVVRSLAQFCVVLDTLVALVIVIATV